MNAVLQFERQFDIPFKAPDEKQKTMNSSLTLTTKLAA